MKELIQSIPEWIKYASAIIAGIALGGWLIWIAIKMAIEKLLE